MQEVILAIPGSFQVKLVNHQLDASPKCSLDAPLAHDIDGINVGIVGGGQVAGGLLQDASAPIHPPLQPETISGHRVIRQELQAQPLDVGVQQTRSCTSAKRAQFIGARASGNLGGNGMVGM